MGLGLLFDAMHCFGWAAGSRPLPTPADWAMAGVFVLLVTGFVVFVLPRHRIR